MMSAARAGRAGLAGLLVLFSLAACRQHTERGLPVAEVGPPRRVVTAEVQRWAAGGGADWHPGTVRARQRAALTARLGAAVVALPYHAGEAVKAGAVVARLDDALPRAAWVAAQAAHDNAAADLARLEALVARQAATPRERDEARTRAAAARATLAAARESLGFALVRAPFAGTLARRHVDVGDIVSPGQALIEIEGLGGLELVASVPATTAVRLRPGMRAEAAIEGQPRTLSVTVRAVSQAGDPATQRFEVRADLPAAEGLRSGVFARLHVPSGVPAAAEAERGAALGVPLRATFARGGLAGVFVAQAGHARLRFVALGAVHGEQVEVRAGLEAGERVVLEPGALVDGARIEESR
jgi:RND family efflux transporter MFP subunit